MFQKVEGKKCDTSAVSEPDISHTLPKRTRRHLLNERDKSNTITSKQKLHNKATPAHPTNGQLRYIRPTEKILANEEISNSLESQRNACLDIKVEPQENASASEKRSEQFEMIEIKYKLEQRDDSESNDPLDANVQQIKGLVQALPPNDQQELFNGKRDVPCKPQEKLKIYKTKEIPVKQDLETSVHSQQIGIWQPRLAVSHEQVMVLLAELQENPEAARGFSRMAEGRRRNKRFWTQLARTLNAVRGGAHKNADGWAKYWQDKKRNVKASVARREASCPVSGTGAGGDDQEVRTPLTDVEQRVVAIMGGLAFANGDAQRIPVFCGEGPRNSGAAPGTCSLSTSDDNVMLDPTSSSPPSVWMEIPVTPAPVALEDASFVQPEPLPQAPPPPPLPPPVQPWSSPLPSPPSVQSARPPPSQNRNALKSDVSDTRTLDDENLALLRSQHEEKMAVERERNRLLSQLVEKVDKAVGMLGEVLSRIPR